MTTNPTASTPGPGPGPGSGQDPTANPGDTSTTSDDTGGPVTEGPPTSGTTTTTTDDPTDGSSTDRTPCNRYIECVAVTNPGGLLDAQEDFGEASACWTGTPADAELCITACKAGLAQGHALAPDEPACFECASDDECDVGGGEACVEGNCEVPTPGAAVQPIGNTYCIECHVQGGSASGWFILTEDVAYDNIVNQPALGAPLLLVAPGDHQSSYLWHRVNGSHLEVGGSGPQMPPGAPLPQDVIDEIAACLDQGAPP
ncbi:hypothetical protein [Nannocystis exedens]|uniref:hypothetical protein n=1 Tax=Nannocystis exedens TaxID=54 RepID=UPI000BBA0829|nr:hypothetical protein [Nannocystis exedens]